MKEKLKNKKVVYTIIGIVSVLLVMTAVTYAYWLVTKTQTNENEITAGCLDITISGEKNDIELTNQFPMSDEDGMKLVPYEFTVTNNCNTSVDYQVALEATGDSSNALSATSLKVALNDSAKLYSAYPNVETTIEGAYESRVLGYSKLAGAGSEGSSDTYSLRIWIDKDAPISEMNKTFKSKISITIGQGIESPYEEGTLAYDILSNYGGVNAISEVDSIWIEGTPGGEFAKSMSPTKSYYWGTEMNFDSSTGKYILGGTVVQATVVECRNGVLSDGTAITCSYTLETSSNNELKSFVGYKVIALTSSNSDTNYTLYITAQSLGRASNNFSEGTTTLNAGVYKTQDDLGDSYYFRGNVTNNYVQFGEYTEGMYVYEGCEVYGEDEYCWFGEYSSLDDCESSGAPLCKKREILAPGTPMYWRIVRINGDGTIRLVYDGTTKAQNGTYHVASIAYTKYDNNKIAYTYDKSDTDTTQVDSTIKGIVDAWYDTYLEISYGKYIADEIFCNDKSVMSIQGNEYDSYISYGASDRVGYNGAPSLKCTKKSDRYTVNDTTNGNGLLNNPIGLITADEVTFAGGTSKNNSGYYLYNGEDYWTSSPVYVCENLSEIYMYMVSSKGYLESSKNVYSGDGVSANDDRIGARPVINLKADVEFTGNGTIDNPYKIVTE